VEDEDGYGITLELPEVKKEDVNVTVENGVLTIRGERRKEQEVEGRRYHRVERAYGCFSRSFIIPDDGDASQVQAKFTDGVLRIGIAKSEAARPKQIEVRVD
jgi:HSP20 family protein